MYPEGHSGYDNMLVSHKLGVRIGWVSSRFPEFRFFFFFVPKWSFGDPSLTCLSEKRMEVKAPCFLTGSMLESLMPLLVNVMVPHQ